MNPISFLFPLKKEGRGLIFAGKFPIKWKLSPLTEVVYYIKNPFPGNFPFYPKFPFNHFPIIRSTLYQVLEGSWQVMESNELLFFFFLSLFQVAILVHHL